MDMLDTHSMMSMLEQITARTRRIETRLTSYLVDTGHYQAVPPRWVQTGDAEGFISVPALDSTLGACLAVVPAGHEGEVNVVHNNIIVAVVNV